MHRTLILIGIVAGSLACSASSPPLALAEGGEGGTNSTSGDMGGSGGRGGAGGTGGWTWKDPCRMEGLGGAGGDLSHSLVGDRCYARTLPEKQRWLIEPKLWKLMPGEPGYWDKSCYGFEARPEHLQFEPITWTECGPGCEVADLWQGFGDPLHTGRMSIRISQKSRTLKVGNFLPMSSKGRIAPLRRLIDLDSGETLGALWLDYLAPYGSPCAVGWRDGLDFAVSKTEAGPNELTDGYWNHNETRWSWRSPRYSYKYEIYCDYGYMDEGGRRFLFCGHHIQGMLLPYASELTTIDEMDDYYAIQGDGEGDLIAWPEKGLRGPPRVRGWAPDGKGARVLLDKMPSVSCGVALSDIQMAGFMVDITRGGGCDSTQGNPRFWVSPRIYQESTIPPLMSPVLYAKDLKLGRLTTWGNFVTARVTLDERIPGSGSKRNRVVLARSSDWAIRWFEFENMQIYDAAVGPDYLYVAPTSPFDIYGRTRYLYRYDLSRFDEIGTAE